MSAITYEVGARNTKLRTGLRDSAQQMTNWRRQVTSQLATLQTSLRETREAGGGGPNGGGIFGGMLKANLATMALQKGVQVVKDASAAVGDLVDASDQLGISASTLDKMGRVMEGAGVKTETLRKSLFQLNSVRQAAIAGDTAAADKLAELGITVSDLQQSKLEDTFYQVADGLSAIGDSGKRANVAIDLLGTRQAKMIAGLSLGSQKLKEAMADASGTMKEENARTVDDISDTLQSAGSAMKGWTINLVGGAANAFKKIGSDAKKGWQEHMAEVAGTNPAVAAAQAVAKKAREATAEADEARDKAQAKKRQQALEINAQTKKDIEDGELRVKTAHEESAAETERAATMKESLTATQRYAGAVQALLRARREYDSTPGIAKEEKRATLAKARAAFEHERANQVRRASLPAAARDAEQKAERDAIKAQGRGERIYREKARDQIDRDLRRGKIDPKEAQRRLDELRVNKPGKGGNESTPADTNLLLQDIKTAIEDLGKGIGLV